MKHYGDICKMNGAELETGKIGGGCDGQSI